MGSYLLMFLAALATDLIPIIGPPVWTVMIFMLVKFDLNPWWVLAVGVPGSVLGRYGLGLYAPWFFAKVLRETKRDELRFAGDKLSGNLWHSWLFVLLYALTPLSTTALFSAAGLAKIKPFQILPPFFVGKFVSDAVMLFGGRYAFQNSAELVYGSFSWKDITVVVGGLVVLAVFLFLDWRLLLEKKAFRLNFRIWK